MIMQFHVISYAVLIYHTFNATLFSNIQALISHLTCLDKLLFTEAISQ
jgi:hypothetical protein